MGDGTFRALKESEVERLKDESVRSGQSASKNSVFHVGQVCQIEGSTFRVVKIGKRFMTLRLLPKET
jgi:hypothetical protein